MMVTYTLEKRRASIKKRKEQERKKDLMNFAVAVLSEIAEEAKSIHCGNKESDRYIRLSEVNDAINRCLRRTQEEWNG